MSTFASYQAWRDAIPWTDEEIAVIFDRRAGRAELDGNEHSAATSRSIAESVRKGRLGNRILASALDELIVSCAVCGKTALFRHGIYGFCRDHKHVKPSFVAVKTARIETRSSGMERRADASDRLDRARRQLKSAQRPR